MNVHLSYIFGPRLQTHWTRQVIWKLREAFSQIITRTEELCAVFRFDFHLEEGIRVVSDLRRIFLLYFVNAAFLVLQRIDLSMEERYPCETLCPSRPYHSDRTGTGTAWRRLEQTNTGFNSSTQLRTAICRSTCLTFLPFHLLGVDQHHSIWHTERDNQRNLWLYFHLIYKVYSPDHAN